MKKEQRIHVGTSGWHYEHWKGVFYPPGLPKDAWLNHYAESFHTVEVNNSFYRLPSEENFRQWQRAVPPGFVFSVKASRYITHMKKLKDAQEPVATFIERVASLGDILGPILFQLPPRWRFNPDRLEAFLEMLPKGYRYVFEFRDRSWLEQRAFDILKKHGAGLCLYQLGKRITPMETTADFVYARLHSPEKARQGEFGRKGLMVWAEAFAGWARNGLEAYCYFNNDPHGYALRDVRTLLQLLDRAE